MPAGLGRETAALVGAAEVGVEQCGALDVPEEVLEHVGLGLGAEDPQVQAPGDALAGLGRGEARDLPGGALLVVVLDLRGREHEPPEERVLADVERLLLDPDDLHLALHGTERPVGEAADLDISRGLALAPEAGLLGHLSASLGCGLKSPVFRS